MEFDATTMTQMLEEARAAQHKIDDASRKLKALSVTATTKDRTLAATVDAAGTVTDLKFSGRAWRELPPADLAKKIVAIIAQAQNDVRAEAEALMSDTQLGAPDVSEALGEHPDLAAMLDSVIDGLGMRKR